MYLCGIKESENFRYLTIMLTNHTPFLRRCFALARLGAGRVSPNPMVGAVLVYEGSIIGEGWHQRYGAAHAEVNCLAAVREADRVLIPRSTLYCSLEPCFHFGKTPPCVDLVIRERIPSVVVSNIDTNPLTGGQGLQKLIAAGVQVTQGILESEGYYLNRAFFTQITQKRPYVILKWAQSRDGYLGKPGERTPVSGPVALRYVHRLRSESDAILIGTNTVLMDNPRLDNRFYPYTPALLRIAYDRMGSIPDVYHLLDDSVETWIYGQSRAGNFQYTHFFENKGIPALLEQLRVANKAILLIEGGAITHKTWLASGYWDEIQVIQNKNTLGNGIPAPELPAASHLTETIRLGSDTVQVLRRKPEVTSKQQLIK